MPDLLLEIGLEEVPARMLQSAQEDLVQRVTSLLDRERLATAETNSVGYSTPRRLAIHVTGVRDQQLGVSRISRGPAYDIAYNADGTPTRAAEAFARKMGVALGDCFQVTEMGKLYLAAQPRDVERTAAEVLAAELPKEIAGIYWAKNMRWIPGSNEKFVRPVLWLVCLLDEEIVPLEFAGKTAGRATYGHRVLSSGEPFEIQTPASYLAQLEGEYVLADVELRRQKIRKALDHVTRTVPNTRWREDHDLVDAVTHLTEWPDVLLGNFEPAYLTLPEEVLVTVMRDHQKYFAVEDASGKLAPHFLTVTNIALDEVNTPIIKQGNERVLRARFNDARFFWEFDQRTPLADRVKLLENVTFQKDLGSYSKKSERVYDIADQLGSLLVILGSPVDLHALRDAARLAKTDLTTELVKEFTELQGEVGGLYARHQGHSAVTADAIYDQYRPSSTEDRVPRTVEGQILAIADKIDTIAGMFSLGLEPTGSKDPFALRRAANGIVKILSETSLPFGLLEVIYTSKPTDEVAAKLNTFFTERIDFYLREARNQAYDVVKSVMAAGTDDLRDLVARAEAVSAARGSEDFLAVSAAFKRMKNILTQAREKGDVPSSVVDHDLLLDPSEKLLAVTASAAASAIEMLQAKHDYSEALRVIATLRPSIDDFFDKVMVMAPEPDIRANRLALLNRTLNDLSRIADFSEIVIAG